MRYLGIKGGRYGKFRAVRAVLAACFLGMVLLTGCGKAVEGENMLTPGDGSGRNPEAGGTALQEMEVELDREEAAVGPAGEAGDELPGDLSGKSGEKVPGSPVGESRGTAAALEPESPEITLVMVGDILLHTPVAESGRLAEGGYDFSALFGEVKEKIAAADLALVNQEVIIGGEELGEIGRAHV